MLVFVSWLLFFAPPNGNLREFGPSPQELRRSGLSFVTQPLRRRLELQRDHALHRHRAAIHGV